MKKELIIYKDLAKKLSRYVDLNGHISQKFLIRVICDYRIKNDLAFSVLKDLERLKYIKKLKRLKYILNLDLKDQVSRICQICGKEIEDIIITQHQNKISNDITLTSRGNTYHKDCYLKK